MLFWFDVLTFAGTTGAVAACRLKTNAKVSAEKERALSACFFRSSPMGLLPGSENSWLVLELTSF